MSTNLKNVFERAKRDSTFAKELLFDGAQQACDGIGVNLNKNESVVLTKAVDEIKTHFFEKLYIISLDDRFMAVSELGCTHCHVPG